ncbi:putative protein AIR2 [Rosellinia necatrix]|uniref:CCHC-type domain-containing protein n=1 Tax=Rosellinia necatrix TaxID=77044 RepID=A0A1S7UIT7_ROSNE|nr:putative protein AIR2 [Rosellinia necatrix]
MEHPLQSPSEVHASPKPFDTCRDSPVSAPQKRPYAYGEELKGLDPSEDEGNPRELSKPAFKRRKMGRGTAVDGSSSIGGSSDVDDVDDGDDGDDGSDGSDADSDGVDDGEIVESPLPSGVAAPMSTESPLQASAWPQPMNTSNVLTSISSEEGEIIASEDTKEDSNQTQEVDEERDPGESEERENASSAVNKSPQASLPNWNHGIKLGTRTTFGAKSTKSFFINPSAAVGTSVAVETPPVVETTDGNQEEQPKKEQEKEKKRVRSRDPVSFFEASNAKWNFPLSAQKIDVLADISEEDRFWPTLLKDWIARLVQENSEAADRLTYKVVRAGWSLYITKRMGFIQGTKRHMIATRTVAQNFMASLNKDKIDAMVSDARQKEPATKPDGDVSAAARLPPSHDEEFRLQTKYFPNADDPSRHCLSCSGIGHATQTCPELSCRFCESKEHSPFGCPTKRRCDKCLQTGHGVDTCQEKLALAPDELGGCAFCNADHQDEDCSEIWRSFIPSELNIKKVQSIPAFCYVCGGENHYGPECSLSGISGGVIYGATWSKANRDLYVDPKSEAIAIAWTGIDINQLTRPEFHILGRATRKTHTYFFSSDESEEELIHAPVAKPQTRGEIRIASNIGTMNGNSHGQGGRKGSHFNPCLLGHYHHGLKSLHMVGRLDAAGVGIAVAGVVVEEENERSVEFRCILTERWIRSVPFIESPASNMRLALSVATYPPTTQVYGSRSPAMVKQAQTPSRPYPTA